MRVLHREDHAARIISSIEALESRIAPATLLTPNSASFTDEDGDLVTVKFSKAFLDQMNVNSVITTSASGVGEHLNTIDLTNISEATGTSISVTAKLMGNGDGLVNVTHIESPVDLGAVVIRGDLRFD